MACLALVLGWPVWPWLVFWYGDAPTTPQEWMRGSTWRSTWRPTWRSSTHQRPICRWLTALPTPRHRAPPLMARPESSAGRAASIRCPTRRTAAAATTPAGLVRPALAGSASRAARRGPCSATALAWTRRPTTRTVVAAETPARRVRPAAPVCADARPGRPCAGRAVSIPAAIRPTAGGATRPAAEQRRYAPPAPARAPARRR